jgi:hypothetical protein
MRYKFLKKSHFVYPAGKLMTIHILRYQGLAVRQRSLADGFVLEALDLGYPRLSLNKGLP